MNTRRVGGACRVRGQTRVYPGRKAIVAVDKNVVWLFVVCSVVAMVERDKQVKRIRKHGEKLTSKRARHFPPAFIRSHRTSITSQGNAEATC